MISFKTERPITDINQMWGLVDMFNRKILWTGYLPNWRKETPALILINTDGSFSLYFSPKIIPIMNRDGLTQVFGATTEFKFTLKGGGKIYRRDNSTHKAVMLNWDHWGNMLYKISYKASWDIQTQKFMHAWNGANQIFIDKILVAFLKRERRKYLNEKHKRMQNG